MTDHTTSAHHTAAAPRRRTKRLVAGAVGAVVAAGLLGSCGIAASRENAQQPATSSTAAPPATAKERPSRQDGDTTDADPSGTGRRGDSDDSTSSSTGGTKRTPTNRRSCVQRCDDDGDRASQGSTSKDAYVTKANAVCREAHDELAALGSAPEGDAEAANAYAKQGVDIVQRQLDGLKAIPKPKGDEAKLDEMLGHVQGIVDAYQAGFEAGKAGDQAKVDAAHSKAVSEARAADRIALAYGLDVCAE